MSDTIEGDQGSRLERIRRYMEENRNKSELEASYGYCAALVDGQDAVALIIAKKQAAA